MATRNGERYIGEQLASILAQLEPEDELIVSDDSSTDHTLEIVRGLQDSRIRLLDNNRFFSPTFNFEHALKHAEGDILVLSDQDDVWLAGRIALIRDRFRCSPTPVHLLVLDGMVVDETGAVLEESIFRAIGAGQGLWKNIYDNTYMGCCMAFSRPLLEVALPFPKRIPMHDMWLGLLAELFGTVEFLGTKTIRYRRHAGSATELRHRRFRPWTQIKRRLWLSWSLGGRALGWTIRRSSKHD